MASTHHIKVFEAQPLQRQAEGVLLQQCAVCQRVCAVVKSKRRLRALSARSLPSKVMDICCHIFLLSEAALIPP